MNERPEKKASKPKMNRYDREERTMLGGTVSSRKVFNQG